MEDFDFRLDLAELPILIKKICCSEILDSYNDIAVGLIIILAIVGSLYTIRVLFGLLVSLYSGIMSIIRPSDLRKLGSYAVVTGGTDGIGLAYAKEMARAGLNVLIISRNSERLKEAASIVREATKNPITVRTLTVDFDADRTVYEQKLKGELEYLEVGILINNVGVGYEFPEYFHDIEDEKVWKIIDVNVIPATLLTHMVLREMVLRGRGAIVNVSSSSGLLPTPLLAQYSASKAYLDFFSRSLHIEYAPKGIWIQSVTPLFVTSKLSKIKKPSLFTPTPSTFARSAVRSIGYTTRTCGYWAHNLQIFILELLPQFVVERVIMSMHESLRKRGLSKKKNKKKN